MKRYLLAIDQGTTGTTSLLVDYNMSIVGKSSVEYPQHFPKPGWVEHDLEDIWNSVKKSVADLLEKTGIRPEQVLGIGITNQRETSCAWAPGVDAKPYGRAIVWQDRRTGKLCELLKNEKPLVKYIQKTTGLTVDPYFSGSKFQWMLSERALKSKAENGKCLFGTIDSYLLYRMTGVYATDVSNASRTMLMNLEKQNWDDKLCKLFDLKKQWLPEIVENAVVLGKTKNFLNLSDGTPIASMCGDQQSALFGQACFNKGQMKCTYGTGAFALVNTGSSPKYSKHGLLTTLAWKIKGKTTYALEGSTFVAGSAINWLRDGLGIIQDGAEIDGRIEKIQNTGGVVFVPALTGFGAPYWIPEATGLITGITRGTTKEQIILATVDGIAYQVQELVSALKSDVGKLHGLLRVDGGVSQSNVLLTRQAQILQMKIERPKVVETTALGVALQAGLALGVWDSLDAISKKWASEKLFSPTRQSAEQKEDLKVWKKAIKAMQELAKK